MADNLESYFKKKLSEDKPGDENWNVPSDKVWENVLPEIQKKRGLFIPWRTIYILGILLIAGLISVVWLVNISETSETGSESGILAETEGGIQNQATPDSEELNQGLILNENENSNQDPGIIQNKNSMESAENSNEAIDITENSKSSQDLVVGETASDQEESEFINTSKKSTPDKGTNTNPTDSKITTAEIAGSTSVASTTAVQTPTPYSETQHTPSVNNASLNVDKGAGQINYLSGNSIEDISAPLDVSIKEQSASEPMSDKEMQANLKEPLNNKGKFGLGVFIVPTFNNTTVLGEPTYGAIETSNMLMYSTNWGVELRYHISNRFTLVTGVGKSEIKSWSKSLAEFGYDNSTEHTMPSGEKENTSPVPMQTPFGEIDTELTYRFSGDDDIPDGEPMQSTMETHQDIKYLSIPLGVEFNVIRFSRFNWFLEGGIRYNRALNDATQFTSRVLHDGHDMDVVSEEMTSHPSYTENYLSFYAGTGLNYQFSKSFQISGSARYFGNITKVNLQDNMSTYVQGFDFKIGIVFLF